jgi:phthiocerol/phenolphthiocerol synthesis type-I polyketide synthase E
MNHDGVALDAHTPTTLLISAETPAALDQATMSLAAWATEACKSGRAAWPLPEVAAALRDRRKPLNHRRAVRVESWQDAKTALGDKTRYATAATVADNPKLYVSLPGQGSLRPGVLARLLVQAPEWANHLARLGQLAKELSGFDCVAWLADAQADADIVLKDNAKTQLAIFCVGVSLGRWLLDLGLRPDGYLGHSLGEWMGATLASVLGEADAMRAVHHRGRLMQATAPGAALIVRQTPEALAAQLPSDIALACVNAPNLCLLSGRPDAIAKIAEQLTAARVVCRPAPIHVAVHSPIMDAVVDPFLREILSLEFRAPSAPILSTVTGQWMPEEQVRDPRYWAQQLRSQVRFDKAGATLLAEPSGVVVEVGMGSALTSLLTTQFRNRPTHRALALLGRDEPPAEGYEVGRIHQTLGELWASGVAIDLVGPSAQPMTPRCGFPLDFDDFPS